MVTEPRFPAASALRADANTTDYLVLPLAAGVLAHFLLASDQVVNPTTGSGSPEDSLAELINDARRVLEECRLQSQIWDAGPEPYARVRDVALKGWATVSWWMPVMYASWKFHVVGAKTGSKEIAKWIADNASAPLVDVALAGILGVHLVTTEEDAMPLLSRRARRIRVELAERLRRDELSGWPQIVRTVSSQWVEGGAARFALDLATAARIVGDRVVDAHAELDARWNALQAAGKADTRREARSAAKSVPGISRAQHESILSGERARSRALEERLAALHIERDALATREARHRSRIDALTTRLAAAEERIDMLESGPSSTNPAVEEVVPAAPAEVPDPSALAGRQVILFTGRSAGDVREAMRRSLQAFGAADVTVYWSDRELGPDVVAPDTIVVIDVRYMSHSTSEAIVRLAERSGAWHCVTQRGAALLGRDVALRFLQR